MLKISRSKLVEKCIILLFILAVIISQGIRSKILKSTGINLNSLLEVLFLTMIILFLYTKKIEKHTSIIIIFLTGMIFISRFTNHYSTATLIRGIITFILPLYILLIDFSKINRELIIKKLINIYNIYIYISFVYLIINILTKNLSVPTGGLIGHSLTAGWYYVIFIALNSVYCFYFEKKQDIFILKDITIFFIGTIITSGRVSLITGSILCIIYVLKICKSRSIKYVFLPIIFISIISSPAFNEIIIAKFKFAAGYGDITNGRLLGIREMQFFDIYPKILTGNGIGSANYITSYIFNTINFENPIIMFSFDYGVLSTILVIVITLIIPLIIFLKNKQIYLIINFIIIYIIPYTYNGLSETCGIFVVLIIFVWLFKIISYEKKLRWNNE